jgi:uncharacterized protein with HEPN domain
MSRSRRLFLQGMLECARKVVRYTAHLTREQFFSSELEYDATLRNLEILGEAAKKVPDELKHQYPSVDWRGITLWDIITRKVPELIPILEAALAESS